MLAFSRFSISSKWALKVTASDCMRNGAGKPATAAHIEIVKSALIGASDKTVMPFVTGICQGPHKVLLDHVVSLAYTLLSNGCNMVRARLVTLVVRLEWRVSSVFRMPELCLCSFGVLSTTLWVFRGSNGVVSTRCGAVSFLFQVSARRLDALVAVLSEWHQCTDCMHRFCTSFALCVFDFSPNILFLFGSLGNTIEFSMASVFGVSVVSFCVLYQSAGLFE